MAKRLTEIQKKEIINDFINGKTVDELSKKFLCTKLTIARNLKKNLDENKFNALQKTNKSRQNNLINSKNSEKELNNNQLKNYKSDDVSQDFKDHFNSDQNSEFYSYPAFMEIAPMEYDINNQKRKDLSSVPISEIDFPKIVFMIIDNKIELETKFLREYPDWQFLPEKEMNRNTIEIFFDLKSAKRFCTKEKKVIKVPNTDVFRIVAPLLISRGISRIVSPDKLIAL